MDYLEPMVTLASRARRAVLYCLIAVSFQAYCLCPVELALARKQEWGVARLPSPLERDQESRLVEAFTQDGRPILLITDTRDKQRSGVVTTYRTVGQQIESLTQGRVKLVQITPDDFSGVDVDYQDLRIPWMNTGRFDRALQDINPQAIHVAVEGPLGIQARSRLLRKKIPFTTAYHTEFPDYAAAAVQPYLPSIAEPLRSLMRWHLRRFHQPSAGLLVATQTLADKLKSQGYQPDLFRYWSRGVDTDLFRPEAFSPKVYDGLPRPISVYVGRVAAEKSIEDFLEMDIPGSKVVVGDGPERVSLEKRFPHVHFLGRRDHSSLPEYFASADVFIFPSRTDTFGLVQLEALATGIGVIAYDVPGPHDVITSDRVGALATYVPGDRPRSIANLTAAWQRWHTFTSDNCRNFALERSWKKTALQFLHFLTPLPDRS